MTAPTRFNFVSVLDDDLKALSIRDVSSGQWSFQDPSDIIVFPENGAVELLDIEIDKIGQRGKRNGYTLKANNIGAFTPRGIYEFPPPGGTRVLLKDVNGKIYSWDGAAASWTSRKTGLTDPTDFTEFISGNGKVFRQSQTDHIWSSADGVTWNDEADGNTSFPKSKFALWTSTQRMLAFNTTTEPGGGYYSNAGDPQTWDRTTNLFRFGPRDTGGVTGAIEFTSMQIMVMTEKTMELLDISNATPANWTKAKIGDIGCLAPRTVQQIGEDALFLSVDGVRSILQSAQDKKRGASLPISFPIQDWIDRINWPYVYKACAWVWDDKYYLAVPIDLSTYNNYVLVWSRRAFEANQKRGGWTICRNLNVNGFAESVFSGVRRLYFCEASASAATYFFRSAMVSEESTNDNGTAISYSETGKRYDLGYPDQDKTWQTVEVECIVETSGTIKVEAQVDGGGWTTVGTLTELGNLPTLPVALPFDLRASNKTKAMFDLSQLGRGRNIQIRLTETTLNAPVAITRYTVTAFVENVEMLTT